MHDDIDHILISQQQIAHRVVQMAHQITTDYAGDGQLTIVPILTGAMIFCADLIRHMPIPMKIGLLTISSYPGATTKSQGVTILDQHLGHVKGRKVLVVDDIIDSGNTLQAAVPLLYQHGAAVVRSCVLLRKDRQPQPAISADYIGFDIPDEFVVGYGLDHNDDYRNLPDIVALKPRVFDLKCRANESKLRTSR
ncbi:MAG: hypoxanthine phosphoribosyltransferase [Phycisphaerales bacterium]|nr:hypoxanthine phosphoribosyltransferase [Phycisphaerales bacterium]